LPAAHRRLASPHHDGRTAGRDPRRHRAPRRSGARALACVQRSHGAQPRGPRRFRASARLRERQSRASTRQGRARREEHGVDSAGSTFDAACGCTTPQLVRAGVAAAAGRAPRGGVDHSERLLARGVRVAARREVCVGRGRGLGIGRDVDEIGVRLGTEA